MKIPRAVPELTAVGRLSRSLVTTRAAFGLAALLLLSTASFAPLRAAEPTPAPKAAGDVAPNSIAVLPFAVLSPGEEDGYLADGLCEEIISVLARDRDLRVAARSSSMKYRGTPKTLREVGTELGVAYIVNGSVRRADSRVRIVVELVKAKSEVSVWSETIDRKLEQVIVVQEEIAATIEKAVKLNLPTGKSP